MDAAARAELDALRRRAYGPSPDIAGDDAALGRLIVLEELALPSPRVEQPAATAMASAAFDGVKAPRIDATPVDARVIAVLPAPASHRPVRPRWHAVLVAAVALVALPLGALAVARMAVESSTAEAAVPAVAAAGSIPASVREALSFTSDPRSETLIQVRIDGYFGTYVDVPDSDDVPLFPVEGLMTWVEPLGDYYGWNLWIGGARGAIEDEDCILLDGDGTMRADCVSSELRSDGALLLSVPYAELAPEERPEVMTPDQSLGFWWGPDGAITILLSPTPSD